MEGFARNIFRGFDQRDRGRVNFYVFITTLDILLKGSLNKKTEWLFEIYDEDRNGILTMAEAVSMLDVS